MAMTLRADKGAILSWNEMDANFRACLGVHNFMHVQDQKPAGTSGGTFTSGAWRTRTLNTVVLNNIASSSLSANQITLPAGNYYCDGKAPVTVRSSQDGIRTHQCRLYNISALQTLIIGSAQRLRTIGADAESLSGFSFLSGHFSLTTGSVIELQHECGATCDTWGFGHSASSILEVFSDLKIWKLS